MWRSDSLSLEQYADLCEQCPISAAYSPEVVQFYFSRLGYKPVFAAMRDRYGELVAAFPSLYRVVFPSVLHKRLLGRAAARLGDFGQPESLFPVLPEAGTVALNHLSPTTSALLNGRVRSLGRRSLRRVAIARDRKHKKLSARVRAFSQQGGRVHFAEDVSPAEFAEIYLHLHCRRWGYALSDLAPVRAQILALYPHIHGVLLTMNSAPVAAQLCFRHIGTNMYYVDFINSGVERTDDNSTSYGSVMMLVSLRHAEQQARSLSRQLRFSFGFSYSDRDYKAIWADPEPTFIGF